MQGCELIRTARWSAVASQEGCEIIPVLAFAPGKPQRSGPTAFRFAVGLRAGVNDQADWVNMLPRPNVE